MSDKRKAVASTLAKIDEAFNSGDYYEALQLYRTVARRLSIKKQYDELITVLSEGVERLLKCGEGNAGGDLAGVLLETSRKAPNVRSAAECSEMFLRLFRVFPNDASCVLAKRNFMDEAIKYVESLERDNDYMSAKMHTAFAEWLWGLKDHRAASMHFIDGDDVELFSRRLREWADEGFKEEHDLFYARPILNFAACGNLRDANALLAVLQQEHRRKKLTETPLMRFLEYLLLTLERKAPRVFVQLKRKYEPSLQRDPELLELTNLIGRRYYDIAPPQQPGMGLFSNLMSGLMQ